MTAIAKNPLLPGFYPDPSICAVGDDFYIVNSTFAYFPGLPVLHSKDLAHWEQIGNVLDRESQLPLQEAGHSNGLFAPTIRFYKDTFYVICTNVTSGGNFIVTAKDPAGPWSEPHYIKGADGIDPSLFFDEDGTCYYIGTHPNPEGCKYDGDWYIWVQELNLEKMELVGEHKNVWNGAMRNIIWPEGPHLYKRNGMYYIVHAEGGTGPDHAVTVCRSKNIWGPYENNFCNPILTHRHLGQGYPIKYVGHADLVETSRGEWYMVMLAVRPLAGYTTMGRETFLAKVTWENGWPVVNPGVGMLTETVEINLPEWIPETDGVTALPGMDRTYDFTKMQKLGSEFLQLRNPAEDMYSLNADGLQLKASAATLKEKKSPSYLAIRQQHHSFDVEATLETGSLKAGTKAGIALMQSNNYYLGLDVSDGRAILILCENGTDKVQHLYEKKLPDGEVTLKLQVRGLQAKAYVNDMESENVDICKLSTEVAGGFVGCTVGMYAVAEGQQETGNVCFKSFRYQHKE